MIIPVRYGKDRGKWTGYMLAIFTRKRLLRELEENPCRVRFGLGKATQGLRGLPRNGPHLQIHTPMGITYCLVHDPFAPLLRKEAPWRWSVNYVTNNMWLGHISYASLSELLDRQPFGTCEHYRQDVLTTTWLNIQLVQAVEEVEKAVKARWKDKPGTSVKAVEAIATAHSTLSASESWAYMFLAKKRKTVHPLLNPLNFPRKRLNKT